MSSSAQDRPNPPSGAGSGSGATSGSGAYSGSQGKSSSQAAIHGQHQNVGSASSGSASGSSNGSSGSGAKIPKTPNLGAAASAAGNASRGGGVPWLALAGAAAAAGAGYFYYKNYYSKTTAKPFDDGRVKGVDKFDTKYVEEKYKEHGHNPDPNIMANAKAQESRQRIDTKQNPNEVLRGK
ncbi:glycine-rich protein 1-like [Paramacrobiotus metropolitanus]|uniref:glycine-rich protein 1-like n=1 Tax=Paramacrobiotus metropolitanus TaxID=2943436 RepID=UPI002445D906|nr:glycine-rich protein 1-like [Paramacrobiotus metropolitanus]